MQFNKLLVIIGECNSKHSRQNISAGNTLRNITHFYHKYGTGLLLLLWAAGLIFLSVIGSGILSRVILAWVLFLIFIIWDKQSKNTDCEIDTNLKSPDKVIDDTWKLPCRWCRILTIIFFVGVTTVLFILQYYELRPDCYFIICSLLAGVLAISILFSPTHISSIAHLIKIGVLSFLTTFSLFKVYYWTGNDTWAHTGWNELVADIGNIYDILGKEVDYPLQHVFVAITDILTAVDIRTASVFAIGVPSVLLSLAVYVIMRKLIGEKFALVACLLTNLSAFLITWRMLSQTTSYGVLVFLILFMVYLFVIFSENKKLQKRFTILYFLLLIALCLGHQFTGFMVLFILVGGWFGSVIYHKSLFTKEFWLLASSAFIAFIVWLIASFGFNQMVSRIVRQFTATSEMIGVDVSVEPYINITPPSELVVSLINPETFTYLCLLSIIYLSVKYALSSSKHHKALHIFAMCLGLLFSAHFINGLLGGGMAHRFLPILAVYVSICIAYLFWYITVKSSSKKKYLNAVLVVICVLVVVFSMVNLPYSEISPDNPIYVKGTTLQGAVTSGDLTGLKTLSAYYPDDVSVYYDNLNLGRCLSYTTFLHEYAAQQVIPAERTIGSLADWNNVLDEKESHVILRDELYTTPAYNIIQIIPGKYSNQYIQLTSDTLDSLIQKNKVIYANGDISSLIIV